MNVKNCPICKGIPIFKTESLDRGNGHGYPGCYLYKLACSNKMCPMSKEEACVDTVYNEPDVAQKKVVDEWNKRVDEVETLIKINK